MRRCTWTSSTTSCTCPTRMRSCWPRRAATGWPSPWPTTTSPSSPANCARPSAPTPAPRSTSRSPPKTPTCWNAMWPPSFRPTTFPTSTPSRPPPGWSSAGSRCPPAPWSPTPSRLRCLAGRRSCAPPRVPASAAPSPSGAPNSSAARPARTTPAAPALHAQPTPPNQPPPPLLPGPIQPARTPPRPQPRAGQRSRAATTARQVAVTAPHPGRRPRARTSCDHTRPPHPGRHPRQGRPGRQPAGPAAHPASADLALLAGRLTDRDHHLCRLLHEHRVLTTSQIRDLAFGSLNVAQHRLVALARLGVLVRFRPVWTRRGGGSAPWHYVLGPAGAAVLAAEQAITPAQLSYRRDRTLAIAHSQRLAHQVGINGFFTALAARARSHPDSALLAWWSERQCADRWGHVVRPDGYGRWRDPGGEVDFFLEYDTGTEPLDRLLAKVDAYAELAAVSEIDTPVLFWLPGPGREAALHHALGRHGPAVTLATAAARSGGHPTGRVWLPAGASGPRRTLAAL